VIFKSDGKGTDLNGFLDRGSHLQGELAFDTTFRIDGRFNGHVKSNGDLIVGESGEVEGEIEVGQIFVSGNVRGTVIAQKKVEITPTGKVYADLTTPSLVVGNGALFEGRCVMVRAGAPSSGTAKGGAEAKPVETPAPEAEAQPVRAGGKENSRAKKGDAASSPS
jgi:cytoskeletal protein CcmA (bactofilin family)